MAATKQKRMRILFLPDELIFDEILPRLPVRHLKASCQYVCKSWHRIIFGADDHKFALDQWRLQRRRQPSSSLSLPSSPPARLTFSPCCENAMAVAAVDVTSLLVDVDDGNNLKQLKLCFAAPSSTVKDDELELDFQLLSSLHGLLLLSVVIIRSSGTELKLEGKFLHLYNPIFPCSAGIRITQPDLWEDHDRGLAYDPNSNRFKVVIPALRHKWSPREPYCAWGFEVFDSSCDNSWSMTDPAKDVVISLSLRNCIDIPPVLVQGVLHWHLRMRKEEEDQDQRRRFSTVRMLLFFEPWTETAGTMALPEPSRDLKSQYIGSECIGQSKDRLTYMRMNEELELEFWVLYGGCGGEWKRMYMIDLRLATKRHAVKDGADDDDEWHLLLNKLHYCSWWKVTPLWICTEEKVYIKFAEWKKTIIHLCYDRKADHWSKVFEGPYERYSIFHYGASLLSPTRNT